MKRIGTSTVLLGIITVAIFTADASAYYHPTMGRFLQRDPGAGNANRIGAGGAAPVSGFIPRDPTGTNQYADGMNLYQYVGSNPAGFADPFGLNKGPCVVKQVSGADGDGSFGPHDVRKRNIWRPSRTIKDERGEKHKVGHTWITCGARSYGFYPLDYKKGLWEGDRRSIIPGMYKSDPKIEDEDEDKPMDPMDGKDSKGRPIQPDWIWTTEVPERPDGPARNKLTAGTAKGTLCCKATDSQIRSCVDGVARSWIGTQWRLDRYCQDMVADILAKCCMTAPTKNRQMQLVRQAKTWWHGGGD